MLYKLYDLVKVKKPVMIPIELVEALIDKFPNRTLIHSPVRFTSFPTVTLFILLRLFLNDFFRITGTHQFILLFDKIILIE